MKFVTLIFQLIAVSLGALGGLWLKSKDAPKAATHTVDSDHDKITENNSHVVEDKKSQKDHEKKNSKSSHGAHGTKKSESGTGFEYIKFSRQFIVPVITSSAVKSLVVLDVSLEVPSSATESVYSQEPKIRDVLLSALLNLSSEQKFSGDFLDQQNIDTIREKLLDSAKSILYDDVHNVLILSISRQDL